MRKEKVRGWQRAFGELNEAKAYNFLIRSGYTSVEFIPRNRDTKTPDLRAKLGNVDVLCEAKTINRSERAIVAQLRRAASSVPIHLGKEFFAKIASTIKYADQQMGAFSSALDTKRIIYVVINFDDRLHEYVDDYLIQIQEQEKEFVLPGLDIVLDAKPKFYSANPISEVVAYTPVHFHCTLANPGRGLLTPGLLPACGSCSMPQPTRSTVPNN